MQKSYEQISKILEESISVKRKLLDDHETLKKVYALAQAISSCFKTGNKVIAFGNGGSAADADHLVGEFVGWFSDRSRKSLEAITLTDIATLTAIANDSGYENAFARQIESKCKKGDIVIGYSTSGKSKNVINALKAAGKIGAATAAFTGQNGIETEIDYCIRVPSLSTPRIQECHHTLNHILCYLVEEDLKG